MLSTLALLSRIRMCVAPECLNLCCRIIFQTLLALVDNLLGFLVFLSYCLTDRSPSSWMRSRFETLKIKWNCSLQLGNRILSYSFGSKSTTQIPIAWVQCLGRKFRPLMYDFVRWLSFLVSKCALHQCEILCCQIIRRTLIVLVPSDQSGDNLLSGLPCLSLLLSDR